MDINTDRTINFGKYKGTAIKQLILEHICYIYWCLSNLEWFKLNADEQALYDAVAIANIKYEIDLVFPVRELAKFIVDKESYSKLDTPFIISRDGVLLDVNVSCIEFLRLLNTTQSEEFLLLQCMENKERKKWNKSKSI